MIVGLLDTIDVLLLLLDLEEGLPMYRQPSDFGSSAPLQPPGALFHLHRLVFKDTPRAPASLSGRQAVAVFLLFFFFKGEGTPTHAGHFIQ